MLTHPRLRLFGVVSAAMLAFAANSLLCREALVADNLGAGSFTLIRLVAGAMVLTLLAAGRSRRFRVGGHWLAAAALLGYALTFSFAYNSLSAATGALLLFGAVQVTMVVYGLWSGERINRKQMMGMAAAGFGLIWLLLPGVHSPPFWGALLMLGSGFFWGVYSLLGRGVAEPLSETAGNFLRTVPFALIVYFLADHSGPTNVAGFGYAAASGALASGLGYAMWYTVLPDLPATTAAMVQLSVPVLTALGGVALLGEAISARFLFASIAVLGGIGLFVTMKNRTAVAQPADH